MPAHTQRRERCQAGSRLTFNHVIFKQIVAMSPSQTNSVHMTMSVDKSGGNDFVPAVNYIGACRGVNVL